jgi:transposase
VTADLIISIDETHVCVLDREGVVVHQSKTASTPAAIAIELAKAPTCRRIVFEAGRMAPILFHGLSQLGLPDARDAARRNGVRINLKPPQSTR